MKRIVLISLVLLLTGLAFSSALGGTARMIALADQGGYFFDPGQALRWYSSLVDYPDLAVFELGDVLNGQHEVLGREGLIGHGGGGHLQLDAAGKYGTLAVFFQDQLEFGPTDGAFSALWAKSWRSWRLGLGGRFTTYGVSRSGELMGDRIDSQYLHSYGLGVGKEVGSRLHLEMAGEILNSQAAQAGALYYLPFTNEWSSFGLRIRARYDVNAQLCLIPMIDYSRDDRIVLGRETGVPLGLDAHTTDLGLGLNLRPDSAHLLIISCEYRLGRENQDRNLFDAGMTTWAEGARDYYQILLRSALEWTATPWLTLRAGARYVRVNDEQALSGSDLTSGRQLFLHELVTTPISLGVGVRQGRWTMDFSYNDTAPWPADHFGQAAYDAEGQGYSSLTLSWEW
nr:hypothetical protein [Candidatus Krumholzibacteria bacterium]